MNIIKSDVIESKYDVFWADSISQMGDIVERPILVIVSACAGLLLMSSCAAPFPVSLITSPGSFGGGQRLSPAEQDEATAEANDAISWQSLNMANEATQAALAPAPSP